MYLEATKGAIEQIDRGSGKPDETGGRSVERVGVDDQAASISGHTDGGDALAPSAAEAKRSRWIALGHHTKHQ